MPGGREREGDALNCGGQVQFVLPTQGRNSAFQRQVDKSFEERERTSDGRHVVDFRAFVRSFPAVWDLPLSFSWPVTQFWSRKNDSQSKVFQLKKKPFSHLKRPVINPRSGPGSALLNPIRAAYSDWNYRSKAWNYRWA